MSDNSSITVDQPQPRGNNHHQQNGFGRGRQMIPLAYMRPPSPPTARRTLIIQNQSDIVNVLSSISRTSRQAIYILSGRGYVSQATLLSLPSREQLICVGRGKILYLSGWFQPMIPSVGVVIPSSRANGILHVALSGVSQGVAIATSLIAFGFVEVDVIFICRPGSAIQPDAPGGPREPIRIRVNVPAPQAPMT